ncbi:MAG: thermonuclease family protein [Acidimicrobiales bacterium]
MPARPRHAHRALALALLIAGGAAAIASSCASPRRADGAATVVRAVDGDTIDVRLGGATERVRLLGIDTPETVKPDTPVQCFGPEASARTKHLLPPGTVVVLQRDQEARDRYGRLLAYVTRRRDGLFVNRALVADGYARTLSIEPNTAHRPDLAAAEATARGAGRGLWGSCHQPP